MKKTVSIFICMLFLVLVGAISAFAGTASSATMPATRGFTPQANSYVLLTKGSVTVSTSSIAAIRNLCTADCTYTFNGTGAKWLLKANTPETIYVPPSVKLIVFSVTSSAGTGIYNQRQ